MLHATSQKGSLTFCWQVWRIPLSEKQTDETNFNAPLKHFTAIFTTSECAQIPCSDDIAEISRHYTNRQR